MSDAVKKIIPTWGYHPTKPAEVHHIPEGGKLPEGWFDHPDKAAAARPKAEKAGAGKEPGEGGEPGKEPGEGKEAAEVE